MSLTSKIARLMSPIRLSDALIYVQSLPVAGSKTPNWYKTPVEILMEVIGRERHKRPFPPRHILVPKHPQILYELKQLGNIPVKNITPSHIDAWHDLVEEGISERTGKRRSLWTQDSYKRSLRAFLNHLHKVKHLDSIPLVARFRFKRLPKNAPQHLEQSEVDALIAISAATPRDHAMMQTLRATGIRVGMLRSMVVSDIEFWKISNKNLSDDESELLDLANEMGLSHLIKEKNFFKWRGKALVEGKGQNGRKKVGYARLDHAACSALLEYIAIRPKNSIDALWLTSDWQRPLTESGLYQTFKRIARLADVDASPHDLRHTFANMLLVEKGVDLKTASLFLFHEDPMTTLMVYNNLKEHQLQAIYDDIFD